MFKQKHIWIKSKYKHLYAHPQAHLCIFMSTEIEAAFFCFPADLGHFWKMAYLEANM